MKSITVLFGMALCLAVIGPSHAKPSANGDYHEHQHHEKQIRHRPKRQFPSFYGYHSQWPGQYEQRRDDRDLLPHIYRLLEELSDFVRRPPPPPPQPIYIPYPVQYPGPQYCQCGGTGANQNPNITTRWPDMDDKRQNWGYDDTGETEESHGVNSRPINFDRIPPPSSTTRPPPSVEHGTNQAAQSPRVDLTRRLQKCDASVLSCCSPQETRQQHQKCFALSGCAEYFEKEDVCSTEHIQEVLDLFAATYSPKRL